MIFILSKQGANPPYTSGQSTPYQGVPPTTYHQPRPPTQFQTVPTAPPAVSSATVPGTTPSQMFPGPVANNPTSRFMPSNNPGFVQRPGLSPVQPSSPTQAQGQPQPVVAPPATPATVQTADTSKVSGMWNMDPRLAFVFCHYLISSFTFLSDIKGSISFCSQHYHLD